jgi:FKBP-type peptidyl-prolyl cis-trans isomerase
MDPNMDPKRLVEVQQMMRDMPPGQMQQMQEMLRSMSPEQIQQMQSMAQAAEAAGIPDKDKGEWIQEQMKAGREGFAPPTEQPWDTTHAERSVAEKLQIAEAKKKPTRTGGLGRPKQEEPKSLGPITSKEAQSANTGASYLEMLLARFGGETVADKAGLRKKVTRMGRIEEPLPPDGAIITMHYKSYRMDGTVIEDSKHRVERPWESASASESRSAIAPGPAVFTVGEGTALWAYELVAPTMVPGEKCEVLSSHVYAYGAGGAKHLGVPPESPIRFELQLVNWRDGRLPLEGMDDDDKMRRAKDHKQKGAEDFTLALKRADVEAARTCAATHLHAPSPGSSPDRRAAGSTSG